MRCTPARNLPDWFAELDADAVQARCLSSILADIRDHAWVHHIPRLMVLGNYAMQRGWDPAQVTDWFHRAFVDGYDWVMVPNVVGMSQYADGGQITTKPYAGGGAYINRMSDYCGGLRLLAGGSGRRQGLPVHRRLLVVPRPSSERVRRQSPDGASGSGARPAQGPGTARPTGTRSRVGRTLIAHAGRQHQPVASACDQRPRPFHVVAQPEMAKDVDQRPQLGSAAVREPSSTRPVWCRLPR